MYEILDRDVNTVLAILGLPRIPGASKELCHVDQGIRTRRKHRRRLHADILRPNITKKILSIEREDR